MEKFVNPIAELYGPDSGQFCKPEDAKNFPDAGFFCPDVDCLDPKRRLIVKRSVLNNPFFCHHAKFQHSIHPETLLHKLTIKRFTQIKEFEMPGFILEGRRYLNQLLQVDSAKTSLEYRGIKSLRPDIYLTTMDGLEFAVEIFVTHETKETKMAILKDLNLPAIEIDLSHFYYENKEKCRADVAFVESQIDSLLADLTLKKWLIPLTPDQCVNFPVAHFPAEAHLRQSNPRPSGCMFMILLLFIPVIILHFLG